METTVPERRIAADLVHKLFAIRMAEYREYFERGDPEKAIPIIASAMRAFRVLPAPDQEAFLSFLAVPLFDGASTVLAAVEGLGGEELELTTRGPPVSLQDHFVAIAEDKGYLHDLRRTQGDAV